MPETMPTCPSSVGFNQQRTQQVTRSPFTLKTKIIAASGARWTASVQLPAMTPNEARLWRAFFTKLDGMVGTFYLGDPNAKKPTGTANGPENSISGAVGDTVVTATLNGTLLAGDFIACNDRLYILRDDSSTGQLNIWPPLRDTGGNIVLDQPVGIFRISSPETGWDGFPVNYSGFSFEAEEVL